MSRLTILSALLLTAAAATAAGRYDVQALAPSARAAFHASKRSAHVLADPAQNIWCTSVARAADGKYHAYFAQWPKATRHDGWLTHCSIQHGIADQPEGPYHTTGTIVESRPPSHQGVINAHNPYICTANGKFYLYYISNDLRGKLPAGDDAAIDTWLKNNRLPTVRNSQVCYVAEATNPAGPFTRLPGPTVSPAGQKLFKNIAVNPAVVFRDGRFVMIIKGDEPTRKNWFRIQLAGSSDQPQGPFAFVEQPVVADRQTEDACLWYNQRDGMYNMVCHVMGARDLAWFVSKDGKAWAPAPTPVFMKKEIPLGDGTIWKPERVERPFVLTDDQGDPQMIFLAILDKGISGNIALKLQRRE